MSICEGKPGLLIVLCGPSGVGKSTIARRLQQSLGAHYTVSATTRPLLPNDEKGKTYEHISRDEFFRRLDQDQFFEYAQVHDEYYGTPVHPAMDKLAEGKDVLFDIDVQGALQVRFACPQALLIFILPPDEQALLQRLTGRQRDTAEQITKRIRAARREIHMAKGSRAFDYMVINDDLEQAVDEVIKIVKHKRSASI